MRRAPRALSSDDKSLRREQILAAARELFARAEYEDIGIAAVARKARIAKGTLYLYFATKEELFVHLLQEQFEAWFAEMEGLCRTVPEGGLDVDGFVDLLRRSLEPRPDFPRLAALAHPVLERNIDFALALSFKQAVRAGVGRCGALVETRLRALAPGQGAQLLFTLFAVLLGVQMCADPSPVVRKVVSMPGMELFNVTFLPSFLATARLLVAGLSTR